MGENISEGPDNNCYSLLSFALETQESCRKIYLAEKMK